MRALHSRTPCTYKQSAWIWTHDGTRHDLHDTLLRVLQRGQDAVAAKGISFTEIDVAADKARHAEMLGRANGRRTVPQIFIGATHVGGYDDLRALDVAGRLDPLLVG